MQDITQINSSEQVIDRLRSVHKKEQFIKLNTAFFHALLISIMTLLVFSGIEVFANGNIAFRTFLFYAWLLISIGSLGILSLFPIRQLMRSSKEETHFAIADRVGTIFEDIRDTLHNALQMMSKKEQYPLSALPFINAAFDEVESKSREKNFYEVIDEQERKSALLLFMSALGVSLIMFLGMSPLRESLNRFNISNHSYRLRPIVWIFLPSTKQFYAVAKKKF